LKSMKLKELCELSNIQKEKMRRYIAYFSSNRILEPIRRYRNIRVDKVLLQKFISDIKQGSNIEDVKYKDYWNENYHYLIHRYNNKVLQTVAEVHSQRHSKPNLEEKISMVRTTLKEMYDDNIKITIANVCNKLGIVHETIRTWKCNEIIQEMKRLQTSNKLAN
jgi:hypothetical protein